MLNALRVCRIGLVVSGMLAGCAVKGPPVSRGSYQAVDLQKDLGTVGGSDVLAAPAGWTPTPTLVTPTFAVPAAELFEAMQQVLLAEPRTWLVSRHPDLHQASFIVRSRAFNLPDIVIVQAVPSGDTMSKAVIFTRSRFDVLPYMSVNESRTRKILRSLTARFGAAPDSGGKS